MPKLKKISKIARKRYQTTKKRHRRQHRRKPETNYKRPSPKEYEPTLPSDIRNTLAEKLLLGEELAQYAFGATGSHMIAC